MCFGPEAAPPASPRSGLLAGSERTALRSRDGAAPAATLARTTEQDAPGVVVIPDVRGLHPYYEQLAGTLAAAGVHAVALDPYSRTAGTEHRDVDFDYPPHRAAVTDTHLVSDAAAGAEALRGIGVSRCYGLGFCFGGRAALLLAAEPGWSGVVAFYGPPTRVGPEGRSPLEDARAGRVRSRVLALFGGADKMGAEPPAAYEEALTAADVPHETVVYPGAPHSFFDRHADDHADACDDAWRRVLDFIR